MNPHPEGVPRVSKNKSNDTPPPESAAASSLLALATMATAVSSRSALQTILPNPTAAPIITVGEINAGILPSPERKVRKTSHQEQIGKQNKRKRKAIHAHAHARATTLIAKERALPKEVCKLTIQVIAQVKGEFRAWGYGVTQSKNTINRYIQLGMVGTFPLASGYEGTMPRRAFDLLVLAVEAYIQINNVKSIVIEWSQLIMAVNMCCGVPPLECSTKHSVVDRVRRSTNMSMRMCHPGQGEASTMDDMAESLPMVRKFQGFFGRIQFCGRW